jgi:predicted hotdog family 3-hydroxylacyl-ACP dehydratase
MTSHIDLDRLLPHRPPMRIVEDVIAIDDASIESVCTVRDSWPTAQDGQVRTLMLLELIAQTAAVLQGWKERHEDSVGQGGLLVGIPAARFAAPSVPVGTKLWCAVRISHGAQSYLAFDGEVRDEGGMALLTGSIQAFRPDGQEDRENQHA